MSKWMGVWDSQLGQGWVCRELEDGIEYLASTTTRARAEWFAVKLNDLDELLEVAEKIVKKVDENDKECKAQTVRTADLIKLKKAVEKAGAN